MAVSSKTKTLKTKTLKCMNSNPETSKWGDWAPNGGCKETVDVSEEVAKVLCWKCTTRSTTQPGDYHKERK